MKKNMKKLYSNFLLKENNQALKFTEDNENFVIECTATTFNVYNENNEKWLPNSFDRCLKKFYGNTLNVVCGLEHIKFIKVGIFEIVETDDQKMLATLRLPKSLKINMEYTIPAIKEGILQGLSTEGWFVDYEFTDKGVEVTDGFLERIDLVSIPADGGARFRNTIVRIKNEKIKNEKMKNEKIENDINILNYL